LIRQELVAGDEPYPIIPEAMTAFTGNVYPVNESMLPYLLLERDSPEDSDEGEAAEGNHYSMPEGQPVTWFPNSESSDLGRFEIGGVIGRLNGSYYLLEPAICFYDHSLSSYPLEICIGGIKADEDIEVDVTIPFASGSFRTKAFAGADGDVVNTGADIQIALKWFNYATSTGASAWSETTGKAINGGPLA